MTRAIIYEENIEDNLWLELIFTMTFIKNNWSTRTLQNLSRYKASTHKLLDLSHLQILRSTIYLFLHKEEQMLKSENWLLRALNSTLVGYNGHTIYRVYIKDQEKVIWVNYLCTFENYGNKSSTKLYYYNKGTLIFQGFLFTNNDNEQIENVMYLTCAKGRKILDIKKTN